MRPFRYTVPMHRPEDTGRRHRRGGGGVGPGGGAGSAGSDRDEVRHSASRRGRGEPPQDHDGEEPLYVFTTAQSREVDRLCAEEFGIPSIVLMENAALGIASVTRDQLEGIEDPCVLIFCGPGNNGGDGLAAARHLANEGVAVSIVLSQDPERYSGDARTNLEIARRMGLPLFVATQSASEADCKARAELGDPDLILDAIFGTGLDRPPTGPAAELIRIINAYGEDGVPVLSVDVPSGLNADGGQPAGAEAVRADVTVALLGLKTGFLTRAAQPYLGECLVAGIGAPRRLIERVGKPMEIPAIGSDGPAPGRDRRNPGSAPTNDPA